jgi:hypothetical protein
MLRPAEITSIFAGRVLFLPLAASGLEAVATVSVWTLT